MAEFYWKSDKNWKAGGKSKFFAQGLINVGFKADNLNLSYSFSHLMQLKGSDSHPLLTLTAKNTEGEERLRVNHAVWSDDKNTWVDEILGGEGEDKDKGASWNDNPNTGEVGVNDKWLDVNMAFSCQEEGYLKLVVRDLDTGAERINIDRPTINLWQGNAGDEFGLKFGLYRKIKVAKDDDQVRAGLVSPVDTIKVASVVIEKVDH